MVFVAKVLEINRKRQKEGESLLKVIMLGDEAQITTESMTPLLAFDTFSRMNYFKLKNYFNIEIIYKK